MQEALKAEYDTLTTNLHRSERSPDYYLQKWKRRQGRTRGGGRIEKFRRISKYKSISVAQVLHGDLPRVFISEYHFYRWNVGKLRCIYCGDRLTKESRTQDHVIPKAHGGTFLGRDNLEPACRDCNRVKGDSLLIAFLLEHNAR
jgi:5-methylcytosine-specific restriction endonuclease McrA